MNIEQTLNERSNSTCELCSSTTPLTAYEVPPSNTISADKAVLLCNTCRDQIEKPGSENVDHWRCLNDSMWSQVAPVQVMAWRMLSRLSSESWAQDLLDMLYLEDDILEWAKATENSKSGDELDSDEDNVICRDNNGTILATGDSVTLIKDLDVKGAGFTAKRGTLVKNIALTSNPKHIEGRVNGVRIVLVSAYLKKS